MAAPARRRKPRRTPGPTPAPTSTRSTSGSRGLGVVFTMPPTAMGPVTRATFEDTCGNLISLFQAH